MDSQPARAEPPKGHWPTLLLVAGVGLIAHFLTAANYGIFRDELYYLECARHLDWGYVDHPPLSIVFLKASVAVFGDSQWAIRVLPALAGALLVIMTGQLAARMGGGRFAVLLAALGALIVPVYLINTGYFSMNGFELVFWALTYLILAEILARKEFRLWLVFGLVIGIAMMNKVGVVALAVGLVPALLLTGHASHLKSRLFWLGALLAAFLFLPHVIWQMAHDWPTVEFVRNATAYKIAGLTLPQYLTEQILMMNPALLPFWILGLGALLAWRRLRAFRALGLIWLAAFLFFGLQQSKAYYLSPAYPPLIAAGACLVAFWLRQRLRWLRVLVVVHFVSGGAVLAPATLPMLSPGTLAGYLSAIGVQAHSGETGGEAELPQYLADRFGWENMTATFAEAYHSLSDSLRAECAIVTRNYGEASAINYFGSKYGLPRAISQHNNYYLWGPGDASGEVILAINYSEEDLRETYDSVTVVATVTSPWAMPYETDRPIYLCTGLKIPWQEAWRSGKLFI